MINYELKDLERIIGKDVIFEFLHCTDGEVVFKNLLPVHENDCLIIFYSSETMTFFKHQKLWELLRFNICEITLDNEVIYFKEHNNL